MQQLGIARGRDERIVPPTTLHEAGHCAAELTRARPAASVHLQITQGAAHHGRRLERGPGRGVRVVQLPRNLRIPVHLQLFAAAEQQPRAGARFHNEPVAPHNAHARLRGFLPPVALHHHSAAHRKHKRRRLARPCRGTRTPQSVKHNKQENCPGRGSHFHALPKSKRSSRVGTSPPSGMCTCPSLIVHGNRQTTIAGTLRTQREPPGRPFPAASVLRHVEELIGHTA